ncbi:MAG: hypothetical protein QG589_352 [Patescibacteria group bacterium]|nr:hypothetical protein [Patescibacteria group bacterium]
MTKDDYTGLLILLGIFAIAAFGGAKNSQFLTPPANNDRLTVEQKIHEAQTQVDDLKKQIQIQEEAKTRSVYAGKIFLQYVSRSTEPSQEYVTIRMDSNATTTIPITGWTLKSMASGVSVTIPKGTYLYFTGMLNAEENIILSPGDTAYILTGISPNGSNFKVNKCSGYLSQFQTFYPYLYTNCPAPRNEDLSSIPKRVVNDACFDYIDSMSSCRIQTESLPMNWSYECTHFIYDKINYNSCINTHKGDADFYQKEWRIHLKRSERLWKDRRESIQLIDLNGKIVDTITY